MSDWTKPRNTPCRSSKYMGLAWIHAAFSKDPSTQVGACVVDISSNYVIGTGYNGPSKYVDDESFDWSRPPANNPGAFSKYDMVIHAEMNAVNRARALHLNLEKGELYTTAFPCRNCMKEIIDSGIKKIVYMDTRSDKSSMLQDTSGRDAAYKHAELAGIKIEVFSESLQWMPDWIEFMRGRGIFDK